LDLGLEFFDGLTRFNVEENGPSGGRLDEYVNSTSVSKDEVQDGSLPDVVISESYFVLRCLASKDESLKVGRESLLVSDLGLYVFDGVGNI
jgi:hypothetical protein